MKKYNYKNVAISSTLQVGKKGSTKDVTNHFDKIMNDHAEHGWEFIDVIVSSTTIPAGCLASLLGGSGTTVRSNILVFRKEI